MARNAGSTPSQIEIIVKEAFKGTAVNVTVQGQRHLDVAIGSQQYVEEYVNDKVTNWISEITKLAELTVTPPQASHASYTFGLKHRWTYFLRTLPNTEDLHEPLESTISRILIPAITDWQCSQLDRDILALPVHLGRLGVANPSSDAYLDYTSSVKVKAPPVEQIVSQVYQLPKDSLIISARQEVRAEQAKNLEKRVEKLKEVVPLKTWRALDLATEKGSSLWLMSLPLKEMGFNLNKTEFRDAIGLSLLYYWPITDIPSTCICGETLTIDHAMICMRFVS